MTEIAPSRLATVVGGLRPPKLTLSGLVDAMCMSERLPPAEKKCTKRRPPPDPGANLLKLFGVE